MNWIVFQQSSDSQCTIGVIQKLCKITQRLAMMYFWMKTVTTKTSIRSVAVMERAKSLTKNLNLSTIITTPKLQLMHIQVLMHLGFRCKIEEPLIPLRTKAPTSLPHRETSSNQITMKNKRRIELHLWHPVSHWPTPWLNSPISLASPTRVNLGIPHSPRTMTHQLFLFAIFGLARACF